MRVRSSSQGRKETVREVRGSEGQFTKERKLANFTLLEDDGTKE